ncbi:LPS-assembly protein LptD precursor, partial [Haemophilus influenzae]
FRI